MCERYNGWTNYETWCVHLWLSNDEGSVRYLESLADECFEETDPNHKYLSRSAQARNLLADHIQTMIEDDNPLPDSGMYSDLLSAAIGETNWFEVADAFLQSVENYVPLYLLHIED